MTLLAHFLSGWLMGALLAYSFTGARWLVGPAAVLLLAGLFCVGPEAVHTALVGVLMEVLRPGPPMGLGLLTGAMFGTAASPGAREASEP